MPTPAQLRLYLNGARALEAKQLLDFPKVIYEMSVIRLVFPNFYHCLRVSSLINYAIYVHINYFTLYEWL